MINKILQILFVLLGASIPTSIAATNIIIIAFVILWLIEGKFKSKLQIIKKAKWVIPLSLFILFYVISFMIVGVQQDSIFIFQRLPLLLLLPVFISTSLSQKTLKNGTILFFITICISALLSMLEFELITNIQKILYGDKYKFIAAFLKYNYHNIMLAFSSILALHILVTHKTKKPVYLIIFIFICSVSIFFERGRAGQVIFLLFFLLQIFLSFKRNPLYSFVIFCFLSLLILVASYNSKNLQQRVAYTKQVVETNGINKRGLEDVRYTFYKHSYKLMKIKPIFGYGTGTWKTVFNKNNSFENSHVYDHTHPHNNYLYIWFELGIFGVIIFLAMFYFQIKELLKKSYPFYRITLPVIFLFLMLLDCYIFVFHISIMYIYFYVIYRSYSFK